MALGSVGVQLICTFVRLWFTQILYHTTLYKMYIWLYFLMLKFWFILLFLYIVFFFSFSLLLSRWIFDFSYKSLTISQLHFSMLNHRITINHEFDVSKNHHRIKPTYLTDLEFTEYNQANNNTEYLPQQPPILLQNYRSYNAIQNINRRKNIFVVFITVFSNISPCDSLNKFYTSESFILMTKK